MSLEGQRLGAALAEANSSTVRPNMELRGVVFGDTAKEVAERANAEAYAFYGDLGRYDLDVVTERYIPFFPKKQKKGELAAESATFKGEYYARLR